MYFFPSNYDQIPLPRFEIPTTSSCGDLLRQALKAVSLKVTPKNIHI